MNNIPEYTIYQFLPDIIIKVADQIEREKAFHLVYEVYVEELGLLGLNRLTEREREREEKSDEFDLSEKTTHIVALTGSEVIGCVRILKENYPFEQYCNFPGFLERSKGREVSKLIIRKDQRKSSLALGLFQYVYYLSSHCDYLLCTAWPKLQNYYFKIGFRTLHSFSNGIYGNSLLMCLDIKDIEQHAELRDGVDPALCEMIKMVKNILPPLNIA